ncbi:MAG: hypothetical protein K1000chlam4_00119 [Chlamydiae bacterium]|nr:hypothetical protein [Chlamydiota bacterium]
MSSSASPAGSAYESLASSICNSFIGSLDPDELVDITQIPLSARKAKTSIHDYLKNKDVADLLAEINGIENLGQIVSSTLTLTKAKNDQGRTILHRAASRGDVAMTKFIIHVAPDLMNAPDIIGITPIFYSIASGYYDVARWLVDPDILTPSEKADLSIVENPLFSSPLHLAIMNGEREIALLLKASGASLNLEDKTGFTPGDSARLQYYYYKMKTDVPSQRKAAMFRHMEKEFAPTSRELLSIEEITERLRMTKQPPPSSWKKV